MQVVIELCQRCKLEVQHYIVETDMIKMFVCKKCALEAKKLGLFPREVLVDGKNN